MIKLKLTEKEHKTLFTALYLETTYNRLGLESEDRNELMRILFKILNR